MLPELVFSTFFLFVLFACLHSFLISRKEKRQCLDFMVIWDGITLSYISTALLSFFIVFTALDRIPNPSETVLLICLLLVDVICCWLHTMKDHEYFPSSNEETCLTPRIFLSFATILGAIFALLALLADAAKDDTFKNVFLWTNIVIFSIRTLYSVVRPLSVWAT